MNADFAHFLAWESASRDTLDVKRIYLDIADDVIAGLMLSEIIYWHLPSRSGAEHKLRVERDGHHWLAVTYDDWWQRLRLRRRQAENALAQLIDRGLIEKKIFKFAGAPTMHVRLVVPRFLELWNASIDQQTSQMQSDARDQQGSRTNASVRNVQIEMDETSKSKWTKRTEPYTKTTTETTTETTLDAELRSVHVADATCADGTIDEQIIKDEVNSHPIDVDVLQAEPAPPRRRAAAAAAAAQASSDKLNEPDEREKGDERKRARLEMRQQIAVLFGYQPERMTRNEHARLGKVVNQLLDAQCTPEDVQRIYSYCQKRFDTFSPMALVTNASAARAVPASVTPARQVSGEVGLVEDVDDFDYAAWLAS